MLTLESCFRNEISPHSSVVAKDSFEIRRVLRSFSGPLVRQRLRPDGFCDARDARDAREARWNLPHSAFGDASRDSRDARDAFSFFFCGRWTPTWSAITPSITMRCGRSMRRFRGVGRYSRRYQRRSRCVSSRIRFVWWNLLVFQQTVTCRLFVFRWLCLLCRHQTEDYRDR